jgi:phosphate-selective porin OprO/OprP
MGDSMGFQMKPNRYLLLSAGLVVLSCSTWAQEPTESRLLRILHEKGIISDAQLAELKDEERRIREEGDLASELETRIDTLVAGMQDDSVGTSYSPGRGFTFATADKRFSLNISGRLQVRFTYDFFEDVDDRPDFSVARARLWFRGNVFETWMKYAFQFDLAGDRARTSVMGTTLSSSNGLTELKDAYFDFTKWKAFSVRGGQFKTPYSRQWITSQGNLQFVDRSITFNAFAPARQIGLMVYGSAGGEKADLFEYNAGVFTGDGENQPNNDEGMMWIGRVAVNPFGGVKYTESDLADTEDFRMAVGLNAWVHQDDNRANAQDDWSVGGDVAAFWRRFFLLAEIHYRENGQAGDDVELFGWTAQLGYFIVPHTFEVGVRYAAVDWNNNGTSASAQREYLLVLGYFWHEHKMKLQGDFGRVENHFGNHANNVDEWRFRLQFQLIF